MTTKNERPHFNEERKQINSGNSYMGERNRDQGHYVNSPFPNRGQIFIKIYLMVGIIIVIAWLIYTQLFSDFCCNIEDASRAIPTQYNSE